MSNCDCSLRSPPSLLPARDSVNPALGDPQRGNFLQSLDVIWLVVSIPLKNINQLGLLFSIYGKSKMFPNHEPGIGIYQNEINMRSFHGKKCIETKIGSISTHLDEVSPAQSWRWPELLDLKELVDLTYKRLGNKWETIWNDSENDNQWIDVREKNTRNHVIHPQNQKKESRTLWECTV